jgi:hypothetical protein
MDSTGCFITNGLFRTGVSMHVDCGSGETRDEFLALAIVYDLLHVGSGVRLIVSYVSGRTFTRVFMNL